MFKISQESLRINDRFFEAIGILKRRRQVSGIYGFAQKYGISFANLYVIKSKRQGVVKAEYLTFLVRDFGVSAQWLLTGEGDMFKQTTSKTELFLSQGT